MGIIDISPWGLAAAYVLLVVPLAIILWQQLALFNQTLVALLRMSVQLVLVGFYLQVIFDLNNPWLTAAWVLTMIGVADISIVRGCGMRLARLGGGLFIALLAGTIVPLAVFVGPVLQSGTTLDAQYVVPICGMILGNCLRADIVGTRKFYEAVRDNENSYLLTLSQGASLQEALRPYRRASCEAALAPTVASMATIGLVSLPGMMTGVILGGANPMTAIKYQIAIMIAIFSGTALTVVLAIHLTIRRNFLPSGLLDHHLFKNHRP
jgi:putative ABC transport system permease protein